MPLADFLMQSDPAAAALSVVLLDAHLDDCGDAAKGVDHGRDEGLIAQSHERGCVDGVQQLARLLLRQHGRLAFTDRVPGPRTGAAGLVATSWPTTSQSTSMRIVARCCLTDGLASRWLSCSM